MSDELDPEVKAILAKYEAGEELTDDEIAKLPEEMEVEEEEEGAASPAASTGAPAAEWPYATVAAGNEANIKAASESDALMVMCAGDWILIGDHDTATVDLFSQTLHANGVGAGTASVKKGGAFDSGSLTFKGISSYRDEITAHVAAFSKKKVVFE